MSAKDRARVPTKEDGIRLTEAAANEIKSILKEENYPDTCYLYIGAKGGGCSGLAYVLDIRDETTSPISETDEIFISNDVLIICDLKSYIVGNFTGTEVDYTKNLMQGGFVFNNPNAKHTCGCGSSYSA